MKMSSRAGLDQRPKRVTIYQIATEAGVSPSTVSRVLTGNARVGPEKRRAVEDAIERHQFRPNAMARSLTRRESRVIGCILPDVSHPFWGAAFLGAENRAMELGYSLLLGNTMNDRVGHVTHLESRLLEVMLEKQVDAILMMGGRVQETRAIPEHLEEMRGVLRHVPVVTASGRMAGMDCHSVEADEGLGVRTAVNYLVTLGHTRIGFLGGVRGIEPSDTRMGCHRAALHERGLEYVESWCVEGGFGVDEGKAAMETFLSMTHRPTAMICFNDLTAMGAVHTLRRSGLRVPEEMSIVGIDNIPMSEYITPRLTTVDLDPYGQGQTALDLLAGILDGKPTERHVVIQPRLVIRDSCQRLTAAPQEKAGR